ncbi:MAG: hypothetical protein ACLRYY_11460 [Anaerobutyricum soehngenii]
MGIVSDVTTLINLLADDGIAKKNAWRCMMRLDRHKYKVES